MTAEIVFDHVYTRALQGEPCVVHGADRLPVDLPLSAWSAGAGSSDRLLLSHCHGPTLDIGCGPGRMAQELAQRGIRVLGVDVIEEAVRQTRARGVGALLRDVFDPLPGEGRWETALLADGNIGIGGDPVRLLRRVHELLAPGGGVVADVGAPGAGLRLHELTLECGGSHSDPFPWALVGAEQVAGLAAETGFSVRLVDTIGGRWFTVLESQG
ncbi:MAG: methyltransferase domain-containing protein [Nocardioides sp.]